ncbi:hypothetical protein XFF6990_140372 [Xanthomonas citri pv. fuscans]|nr:hypothetical protein XFF6990_140372 [Xanthomonas citri pv. fuscans]
MDDLSVVVPTDWELPRRVHASCVARLPARTTHVGIPRLSGRVAIMVFTELLCSLAGQGNEAPEGAQGTYLRQLK